MNIVKKLMLICMVTCGIGHEIAAMDDTPKGVPLVVGGGLVPFTGSTYPSSQSLGVNDGPPSTTGTGACSPASPGDRDRGALNPFPSGQPTPFDKRLEKIHNPEQPVTWDHIKKTDDMLKELATGLYKNLTTDTASDTQIMQTIQKLIHLLNQTFERLTSVGTDRDEDEQVLRLIIDTLEAYQKEPLNDSFKANVLKVLKPYVIEETTTGAAAAVAG